MTSYIQSIVVGSTVAATAIFAAEHCGRKLAWRIRPSTILTYVSKKTNDLFAGLGKYIAIASSFYTYIDVEDLCQTAKDIAVPTFSIFTSPFNTIQGYYKKAREYVNPRVVVLGTTTLACLVVAILLKTNHERLSHVTSLLQTLHKRLEKG